MKLVRESIKDILVPKKLTQKQKLAWAIFKGDIELLKKAFEDGAKLSYGLLRKISSWHNALIYLLGLEDIDSVLVPKDAEKIKYILNIKTMPHKNYPRSYKQYRVLKYVNDNIVTQRQQIIKLIYELGYGPNSFNLLRHSGYWSTSYYQIVGQYYGKVNGGRFVLSRAGREKLNILHNKFKDQDIDPYV